MEQDVGPLAVSEDGPIMSPWVCRAAFQRSVGKIFYHAGFEDFQPSALDAATDIAADFFSKMIRTFTTYVEVPKAESAPQHFTAEEKVLHTLHKNGLDLEGLETYVKDDVERLNSKLVVVHERMKAHLADLLVSCLVFISFTRFFSDRSSVRLWAKTLVQTVQALSRTAAINLSVETLQKTSMRISSASKSWVWLQSSASKVSACLSTCCRIACTALTRPTTLTRSYLPELSIRHLRHSSQYPQTICPLRSAWSKTSLPLS